MEWREEGVLLARRLHGENAAIIEVFTENHGRHAGIVRGGAGRKLSPVLQPGTQVDVSWRARLEDHLGTFTVEPVASRAATLMGDRKTLAGLNALTALLSFALPERETHAALYHRTLALLDMMGESPFWPLAYVRWELFLLEELGFGLDLGRCAVTDRSDNLVFVSPKSGRAVSRVGAGEWADKMLPLSPALIGEGEGSADDIRDALTVTGHFLKNWVAASLGNRPLPEARARLVGLLSRE
ncbi:MAG: DNA repair protein RecO [Silicimonas sp.]|nr:DNA repair protein RecO [Silicimonas sp.]